MADINDIPYEDIEEFLLANNKNLKDNVYDKTLILLKDKEAIGHTTSIIEWMIAYNLLQNDINIPQYSIDEIDNMSQDEINKIAKLLTMKGNNTKNIKNILRYLHKLDDDIGSYQLISPEIRQRDKDLILSRLNSVPETKLLDITNYDYFFDENNSYLWENLKGQKSRTARRKPKTMRSGSGVTMKRFTRGIKEITTYELETEADDYNVIPGHPRLIVEKDKPEIYQKFDFIMNTD